MLQGARESDSAQFRASVESKIADSAYGGGQGDTLEVLASIECSIRDGCYCFWNAYLLDSLAVSKCPFCDEARGDFILEGECSRCVVVDCN